MMHQQTLIIREQIISAVRHGAVDLNNHIQKQFKISRQAVNRHLQNLEEVGFLISSGNTKNKTYQLGAVRQQTKLIKLDKKVNEFDIYSQDFEWVVENAPNNIQEIIDWGFTEILNNAIDHANATQVEIDLNVGSRYVALSIADDGEGIFNRIRRLKGFSSNQQVALELSKGKLTTDNENHTGLGIFFSLKAFDGFWIFTQSGICHFTDDYFNFRKPKFTLEVSTAVLMQIKLSSKTNLKAVFDAFARAPEFEFDTTIVPMYLANEKQKLVSRSQAKQVSNRLDEFRFVTLDFKGIKTIGQGFADELFRVYPNKHPEISFDTINTEFEVEKMIKRVTP